MDGIVDGLDFQTIVAQTLANDKDFINLLKIKSPTDIKAISERINLQKKDMKLYDGKNLPMIYLYNHRADITHNYLINRVLMRVEVYSSSRTEAKNIISYVRRVLREKFDTRSVSEGERASDIKNVYKYRMEFLPAVWS